MQNKLIQTITFCKRLGKLILGFDPVKIAMQSGEVFVILMSEELSSKSKKEVEYLCGVFDVDFRYINLKLDEIWYLVGKRAGILAICDEKFAKKAISIIDNDIQQ